MRWREQTYNIQISTQGRKGAFQSVEESRPSGNCEHLAGPLEEGKVVSLSKFSTEKANILIKK